MPLNKEQRAHVAVLQRRADFLGRKIDRLKKEQPDRQMGYERHERRALLWAIESIERTA